MGSAVDGGGKGKRREGRKRDRRKRSEVTLIFYPLLFRVTFWVGAPWAYVYAYMSVCFCETNTTRSSD